MTASAMFRRFTPAEVERAVSLYHSNLTIDEVGRKLGRPYQTVRSVLIRAGVEFRPRSHGNRKLEAAALCDAPIGDLPPTHVLQAVDRAALRARAVFRRLDIMRRSSGFPATLAIAAAVMLWAGDAGAQTVMIPAQCGPSAGLVEQLSKQYAEAPTNIGVQPNGSLLQVYASKDGETFTVIVVMPRRGMSCIISSGTSWQSIAPVSTDPAA